jgi:flagellar biosynthesis/type III secretory pathway protein FliH
MLATEWNLEDALRVREEEGIQRGRQEGIQIGEQRGKQRGMQIGERSGEQQKAAEILKLFDTGYSMEEIRERLKADGTRSSNER